MKSTIGSTAPISQLLRRPKRDSVRSLRVPMNGSASAFQTFEATKIQPIAIGEMSSVSVANFRYITRNSVEMKLTPAPGSA